jgi:CO dehydrogenase/acetyl-CoA synthase epsilon subunit
MKNVLVKPIGQICPKKRFPFFWKVDRVLTVPAYLVAYEKDGRPFPLVIIDTKINPWSLDINTIRRINFLFEKSLSLEKQEELLDFQDYDIERSSYWKFKKIQRFIKSHEDKGLEFNQNQNRVILLGEIDEVVFNDNKLLGPIKWSSLHLLSEIKENLQKETIVNTGPSLALVSFFDSKKLFLKTVHQTPEFDAGYEYELPNSSFYMPYKPFVQTRKNEIENILDSFAIINSLDKTILGPLIF